MLPLPYYLGHKFVICALLTLWCGLAADAPSSPCPCKVSGKKISVSSPGVLCIFARRLRPCVSRSTLVLRLGVCRVVRHLLISQSPSALHLKSTVPIMLIERLLSRFNGVLTERLLSRFDSVDRDTSFTLQ